MIVIKLNDYLLLKITRFELIQAFIVDIQLIKNVQKNIRLWIG